MLSVLCVGNVFIIGGGDRYEAFNSVDVLNPVTGQITSAAPLLHARTAHATAASESYIFAFGSMRARVTTEASFNGEMYNPQTNTQVGNAFLKHDLT